MTTHDDTGHHERPPRWAAVGTSVFVALVPGTAVVLIPWFLSGWQPGAPIAGTNVTRFLGVALAGWGLAPFASMVRRFVREGHGTPAPVAPPSRLVTGGSYRWTRNPGYVGVLSLVAGQGLLFGSWPVLTYAAALAGCFHLFVVLYEEPTLRRTFGEDYDAYCRRVPRWLPHPGRS